jgi:hypothetical protein
MVGWVQWLDGYNDWTGTMVGRVRQLDGLRWLDGYNGWIGTMARPVRWLDGYNGWTGIC